MAKKHNVSPGFRDGYNGRLAVDRYEFQGHINGTTDFHQAVSILVDESTPLSAIGSPANVQSALSNINGYVLGQIGSGQGLITVGDGYDTWHNANGSLNYDKTVPSLDTLLNPVFTAIINGTTVPSGFARIQRGGIVVIKAGTYVIKATINIPPGITLMGEGAGTKIVNATDLDLTVSPPIASGAGNGTPVFRVKADANRSSNDGVLDSALLNLLTFQRQTKISNMIISDNFVEATQLGDISNYKLPQNTFGISPLIIQEAGSNLLAEYLMMTGRAIYSSPKVVQNATTYAVALDPATTSPSGTYLQIMQSTFDGFCQPISFPTTAFHKDFLEITSCKMRALGYLNGDASGIANNCLISAAGCDTRIINNHFWGNHINARTILYISSIDTTTDPQSRAKILVTSNTVVIDKSSVGAPAFLATSINPTFVAQASKLSILDAWNNFQPDSVFTIYNPLSLNSSLTISGSLTKKVFTVSTSSYTIGDGDCIIYVNTTSNAIAITLPAVSNGREITIKDISGNAQNNNITLIRNGGIGSIDGYAGSRTISTNGASWTLSGDTVNGDLASWWLI